LGASLKPERELPEGLKKQIDRLRELEEQVTIDHSSGWVLGQGSPLSQRRLGRTSPRGAGRHPRLDNAVHCGLDNDIPEVEGIQNAAIDLLVGPAGLEPATRPFDRAHHVQCDFILQSKNVVERPIVALGP
jgi:hypothetical protein